MNYIEPEKKVCSICLSQGTEHYVLQKKFKYLLNSVSPEMCLEVSEDSYMCCDCLKTLVNLFYFKTRCIENEEKIRLRVIERCLKINISEVVYPYFSIATDINACRLCLCVIENDSFFNLFAKVEDKSVMQMLRVSLPGLKLDITYNPLFCDPCTKKLQMLYKFNKKCMETENKIRIYLENSNENVGKTNKICLLNIIEHFKEAQGIKLMNSKHDCDRCSFRAREEAELNQHKLVFHRKTYKASDTRNKPFKCTLCNTYETNRKCNLSQHLARHAKKSGQMYNCLICHFRANTKRDFNKHKLQHLSKNGISTYQCPKCSYSSEISRNFSRHLSRHQLREQGTDLNKTYECAHCSFATATESDFKQHVFSHKFNKPIMYMVYQCEAKNDTIVLDSLGHKHQEEN